jgi:putative inorganic carbon (HCO3(-)) transporter
MRVFFERWWPWLPGFWLAGALAAWLRTNQFVLFFAMALAAVWLTGLLLGAGPRVRTPADWPMAIIALWLPVNYWASADKGLSIQAAGNLLVGMALFYLVVAVGQVGRRPLWPMYLFLLVGAGLLLAVALVPGGLRGRLTLPGPLLALAQRIPETVNANVLAGALLPSALLASSLALAPTRPLIRAASICLFAVSAAVMALGASRGALFGLAVGVLALLAVLSRWHRLGAVVLATGGGVVIWRVGLANLLELLGKGGATGSMAGRVEVWSRALYALQDFAFTGIGIGTFERVIPILYPYFLIGPDGSVPHAHNLFLQVGVDLGLPGLIAYATIVVLSLWMALATSQKAAGWRRYAAAGVWAGLIGVLVHGLVDAVLWGTKPAAVLWWLLALAATFYSSEELSNGTS